ncbi:hypothetical protein [Tropicibacter oceani]|uniref:Uncharacterized protein n=1 Tax=Tropicibacter oceani TaxID=3058420 RepID=A0ABY8QN13_9RHOB|nr:hypothetical protein [Tropicibacter oceani]WGW05328.1 hypothetical protein QF118_07210 [Tropicibacter oceani]
MRHFSLLGIAIVAALGSPSKAETVVLKDWQETLREAATVSGVVVVGAVLLPESKDPEPRLAAALDPAWKGRSLCVEVISADGLYQSRRLYDLAEVTAGLTVLPYPTGYPERLRAAGAGEISVRARLDGCDVDAGLVPVAWRPATDQTPAAIALQINAFRADSVHIFVGDDPMAEAVACQPVDADVRTAFDTICSFELPTPTPSTLRIEILRVSSGVAAPPEFVDLMLVQ